MENNIKTKEDVVAFLKRIVELDSSDILKEFEAKFDPTGKVTKFSIEYYQPKFEIPGGVTFK
jgi:hypothetical protein